MRRSRITFRTFMPMPGRRKAAMTASNMKIFLDSFVIEAERDFGVVFRRKKRKSCLGIYNNVQHRITIYQHSDGIAKLITTGLHELAHHLLWKRKIIWLVDLLRNGKRRPTHGKEFRKILDQLVASFNSRYEDRLRGSLVVNRRRRVSTPSFVTFEDQAVEKLVDIFEEHFASRPPEEAEKFWKDMRTTAKNLEAKEKTNTPQPPCKSP